MDISLSEIILGALFFFAALIHTSLGFGGGSSYSAIQASMGLNSLFLKGNSLICNTFASGINILKHVQKKQLYLKKALLFTLPALPFTFWGSTFKTEENTYLMILGIFLIVSVTVKHFKSSINLPLLLIILIASIIGFVSGYVGIGGGILIAPFVINKLTPRECTSVTSVFIFLNSITALFGHFQNGYYLTPSSYLLISSVLLGTFIGNYLSFKTVFQNSLFYLLNMFLFIIGGILIFRGV